MAYYRCGPTAIGSRSSWAPVTSPTVDPKAFERPLSGNFDRIFNAFERTNAFEYVKNLDGKEEERSTGHGEVVVNRKKSSSYERADCALAAQTPSAEDEDFYREKILYSQARQLFPLQEDLADWINKTIGITYLTGDNFLDALDNGAELCQLAGVIHERARIAADKGLYDGPVPAVRGRCWQRAARRSFFSRDNADNFLSFCRDLGVHENLLFESDDLVLHNQPRQVVLCLLELARLATRVGLEPPGLVALEREIAAEERDSGLDSACSGAWQFRDVSPLPDHKAKIDPPPTTPEPNEMSTQTDALEGADDTDARSTRSAGSLDSADSDVPLKPTNELDKRVQLVTRLLERGCRCGEGRCSRLLKVKKVGEGRYNIAGRNVFIRLLKGRHMMVRVGGGWDTLEHFLSRHEPCQVRLVTQGRRGVLVPPAPAPAPAPADTDPDSGTEHDDIRKLSPIPRKPSPAGSDAALSKEPSLAGTVSPVDSKASSLCGATSPEPGSGNTRASSKASSGKSSPLRDRTSTPKPTRTDRSSLTLPLRTDQPRTRKQSLPGTLDSRPKAAKTPPVEHRKSLTTTPTRAPKKSRSMSLALAPEKPFCGTERLNAARRPASAASTPAGPAPGRGARSQSLASTPVRDTGKSFCGPDKLGAAKKTRSMSLATGTAATRPRPGAAPAGFTQAAIEESIRQSLAASIADACSTKKPFLHIKAKYRSPPPREVPPR